MKSFFVSLLAFTAWFITFSPHQESFGQGTWSSKTSLPAQGRLASVVFSIANTWIQKANFPGTPRIGSTGFSIGSRGFLGLGFDTAYVSCSDFWKKGNKSLIL